MKKLCVLFYVFFFCSLSFADDISEVKTFFNEYVEAANSYSSNYFNYYSESPLIIRVVEKPNGTFETVNIPFDRYKNEVKKSTKLMKIRKYRNFYSNIKILPFGNDYKIFALRKPSIGDYKGSAYFIIGKDCNGTWKIKEESMNTPVQAFLSKGS